MSVISDIVLFFLCSFSVLILNNTDMTVLKVIELLASSEKSWEDAVKNAVKTASKTVKGIRSVYVQDQSVVVKDDAVFEFRVNCKITFEVFE